MMTTTQLGWVDEHVGMKQCILCEHWFPVEDFYRSREHADGRYPACRTCKRERYGSRYSAKNKEGSRRRKYGITGDQFEALREAQHRCCALCGRPEGDPANQGKAMHVDHCHATGTVRGLLCRLCNLMVGYARDDADLLRRTADYLDRFTQPAPPSHATTDTSGSAGKSHTAPHPNFHAPSTPPE